MNTENPILRYAFGQTIEIYQEICNFPRISLGGVGKLGVLGSGGVARREGCKCKPYITLCIVGRP